MARKLKLTGFNFVIILLIISFLFFGLTNFLDWQISDREGAFDIGYVNTIKLDIYQESLENIKNQLGLTMEIAPDSERIQIIVQDYLKTYREILVIQYLLENGENPSNEITEIWRRWGQEEIEQEYHKYHASSLNELREEITSLKNWRTSIFFLAITFQIIVIVLLNFTKQKEKDSDPHFAKKINYSKNEP